ncbi:hypothetical protein C2W62_44160 [Candidatus Entotheonella serta]|nr:hypothetical protein C2W62_44160 [Candidatus Entotheonella serta]
MARIEGRERQGLSLFGRMVYWQCRRTFGRVPSSVELLAHHPQMFKGAMGMERALMGAKSLPSRLKTLVQLRVAARINCPF